MAQPLFLQYFFDYLRSFALFHNNGIPTKQQQSCLKEPYMQQQNALHAIHHPKYKYQPPPRLDNNDDFNSLVTTTQPNLQPHLPKEKLTANPSKSLPTQ